MVNKERDRLGERAREQGGKKGEGREEFDKEDCSRVVQRAEE